MTQAGLVYLENGDMENGIWAFEDGYVTVTATSGVIIIRIKDSDFKEVLADFCSSVPKPKK